jgi:hypothetical protein
MFVTSRLPSAVESSNMLLDAKTGTRLPSGPPGRLGSLAPQLQINVLKPTCNETLTDQPEQLPFPVGACSNLAIGNT